MATTPARHAEPGSGTVLAGITDEAAPDLAGQLAVLAELGWSTVELRTVDGLAVADLDDRHFARVASELADRDVRVVCVASRIGGWARPVTAPFEDDLAELDVLARRCADLGTRYVRIMSYPNDGLDEPRWRERVLDRVVALAEVAEAAGVVLLHENCSGWAASDADRMLELVDAAPGSSLRLLFDTGNPVAHGYDGYEVLRRIAPHVAHVHVKDARGTEFVDPGTGEARVLDCVRLLRSVGYAGGWSLEPHVALQPHRSDRLADGAPEAFVRAGRAMARLLR
ncbi:sugar phosphate isomerase/epimerase family protein [Umezawaea sp. Da 62-37]|uniref:sugar phosphate isomerase/epimerase family protein n=1 Tax=Umezawaea sp. Da 62-37 TaxID=3075927 RepID=UPI0028F70C42|nr:sugar phosphate isomerase/epimerase family protein [Umezawaea sp. Da 62-37]WNV82866.1 sugar phosphate isomerase/epimerase family protein [Umezawaea sp. Da 62-37]